MNACVYDVPGGQKRALDPIELELLLVLCYLDMDAGNRIQVSVEL